MKVVEAAKVVCKHPAGGNEILQPCDKCDALRDALTAMEVDNE
jgi:hypothetical protein